MSDDIPRDPEHERAAADRRYNDALTAVDRAIVRPRAAPDAPRPPMTGVPPLPSGWRGPVLRAVHRWLAPVLVDQHTFNTAIADALSAATARERATVAALEQFETALIVFLQQITAFVDTKVRVLDATMTARLDDHTRALAPVAEVQDQVQTLQRMVQMLKRKTADGLSDVETAGSTDSTSPDSSSGQRSREGAHSRADPGGVHATYVGFEDRFRGSDAEIRDKQSAYLPIFSGASDVLDIGCGRGEFLGLLAANGIRARGIDVNGDMVGVARERGVDAVQGDALTYVTQLPDESLGGVMCAQVIEHLDPGYLIRLLEVLSRKLRAGAPVVFETINPACWLAFFSSYIRDFTHVRPIHPDTLKYLLHASGFGNVSIRYSAPVPETMKMQPVLVPAPVASSSDDAAQAIANAAGVVNANSAILNNLLFTYMDYAAIAYRS